jgi:hypothetical protein
MAKQTSPPKPPMPFCKDCAHFIAVEEGDRLGALPRCRKFQMTDLVMGEQFYLPCSDVRSPNAPCSTTGKLFQHQNVVVLAQPKPVEPASN